ncbi:MAG: GNAT family N-acetyltransferase [Curvibacter lanceolatus]|uniref:GNAT family N-acetyltransferase n=1 Tax=Curvibacter lanceolatus TaxID=86182 RepID=UPI002356EE94|nr:GNAT family protein [Curvibacter lanceolatus]MBV5291308.1 GNAT family N-acetyltransferase [Curvibacter lanceolatus]
MHQPAEFEQDLEQVLPFVQSLVSGLARVDGMSAIGLRRRGELIAGVVFEGFNGRNIWMHVGAAPGGRWLTREYLRACFRYAFEVRGVQRVSGYVEANNTAARRFDEHLGFREEARLVGAAQDGGDVLLYVMWRKDCPYVDV